MTKSIDIRVVGVSYYPAVVAKVRKTQTISLVQEDDNPHDSNAIAVYNPVVVPPEKIGHIPRDRCEALRQIWSTLRNVIASRTLIYENTVVGVVLTLEFEIP